MGVYSVQFELSYTGRDTNNHEIDMYDVSQALVGFQRSLALTTHLVLHNEIITQSPSLKGASIYALPPSEGSWKISAGIVLASSLHTLGTSPINSPVGNLVHSAYDYVISESLGFHVDYNKSLGIQYEELKRKNSKLPIVTANKLDSLIEKCSTAITEIHRPIYKTKTANEATISSHIDGEKRALQSTFSFESFQNMIEGYIEDEVSTIEGKVSSYNRNTYKGRIYVPDEARTIPFELSKANRSEQTIKLILDSLAANALRNFEGESRTLRCRVKKHRSKSEHLKGYDIFSVELL